MKNQTEEKSGEHTHLISQAIAKAHAIFHELGFAFAEGPLIESEHYCFDALNFKRDHPARDMQDTFWIKNQKEMVLRTHTSPVQVRYMETHTPPIRIIVPGRVYRNEATDATHEAQFFQIEGLYVDKEVTLGHLKGILEYFFSEFFEDKRTVRFRPSFFPFVEPGVEVDMGFVRNGEQKWLEMFGAGMVHPNVLREAGIDPSVYKGFAFGGGIERLIMVKYGIPDIRLLHGGDLRVVNQF